jgi:hypothetical protein
VDRGQDDIYAASVHEVDHLPGHRDRQVRQMVVASIRKQPPADEISTFQSKIEDAAAAFRTIAAPISTIRNLNGDVGQQRRFTLARWGNPT